MLHRDGPLYLADVYDDTGRVSDMLFNAWRPLISNSNCTHLGCSDSCHWKLCIFTFLLLVCFSIHHFDFFANNVFQFHIFNSIILKFLIVALSTVTAAATSNIFAAFIWSWCAVGKVKSLRHICRWIPHKYLWFVLLRFFDNCTACSMIGSWHHNVVCFSVCSTMHCGTQGLCRGLKVVPSCS